MIEWIFSFFENRTFGAARSSGWSAFKREYEQNHPKECAVCGHKKVQLHHKKSFATRPDLELLEENVEWLCEGLGTLQHHRGVGHLGSFLSLNENVDKDILIWSEKIKNRPKWNGEKWVYPK